MHLPNEYNPSLYVTPRETPADLLPLHDCAALWNDLADDERDRLAEQHPDGIDAARELELLTPIFTRHAAEDTANCLAVFDAVPVKREGVMVRPWAAKRWNLDAAGNYTSTPYDRATFFTTRTAHCLTAREFFDTLRRSFLDSPHRFPVRGRVRWGINAARPVNRRMVWDDSYRDPRPHLCERTTGLHVITADFDGIPLLPGEDVAADAETIVKRIVGYLPAEWRDVDCVALLSSSAGVPGKAATISVHVVWFANRPVRDPDLRAWFERSNEFARANTLPMFLPPRRLDKSGKKWIEPRLFDPATSNTNPPFYCARPSFEGGAVDPIPADRRLFYIEGARPVVTVPDDVPAPWESWGEAARKKIEARKVVAAREAEYKRQIESGDLVEVAPYSPGSRVDRRTFNAYRYAETHGLLVRTLGNGKAIVLCTNRVAHSHDTNGTTSTVILPTADGRGLFYCKHSNCGGVLTRAIREADPEGYDAACDVWTVERNAGADALTESLVGKGRNALRDWTGDERDKGNPLPADFREPFTRKSPPPQAVQAAVLAGMTLYERDNRKHARRWNGVANDLISCQNRPKGSTNRASETVLALRVENHAEGFDANTGKAYTAITYKRERVTCKSPLCLYCRRTKAYERGKEFGAALDAQRERLRERGEEAAADALVIRLVVEGVSRADVLDLAKEVRRCLTTKMQGRKWAIGHYPADGYIDAPIARKTAVGFSLPVWILYPAPAADLKAAAETILSEHLPAGVSVPSDAVQEASRDQAIGLINRVVGSVGQWARDPAELRLWVEALRGVHQLQANRALTSLLDPPNEAAQDAFAVLNTEAARDVLQEVATRTREADAYCEAEAATAATAAREEYLAANPLPPVPLDPWGSLNRNAPEYDDGRKIEAAAHRAAVNAGHYARVLARQSPRGSYRPGPATLAILAAVAEWGRLQESAIRTAARGKRKGKVEAAKIIPAVHPPGAADWNALAATSRPIDVDALPPRPDPPPHDGTLYREDVSALVCEAEFYLSRYRPACALPADVEAAITTAVRGRDDKRRRYKRDGCDVLIPSEATPAEFSHLRCESKRRDFALTGEGGRHE